MRKIMLSLVIAAVAAGCTDNPPPTLPPSTPGGGFIIATFKQYGSNPIMYEPSVEIDSAWQGDLAGAMGDPNPFIVITSILGVAQALDKRAPATWRLTWTAAADDSAGCDGGYVTENIRPNDTAGVVCTINRGISSASISNAKFSMTPYPVYISAPPSVGTVTGAGLSTTFGMPRVQYYTMDGTLITQENATTVSPDGTSMQISGFNISHLPVGAYVGLVHNAAAGGAYTFLGTGAVQVFTGPASATGWVRIEGTLQCGSTICDQGNVSINVNNFYATVPYGSRSNGTAGQVASALAGVLNGSSSPVTATVNGDTVNITAKITGFSSDYPLSAWSSSGPPLHLVKPSFRPAYSATALIGGH